MGLICEAFHCLPSEAEREMERLPPGYLDAVISLRSYAHAKAQLEAAMRGKGTDDPVQRVLDASPMAQTVMEIEIELQQDVKRTNEGESAA